MTTTTPLNLQRRESEAQDNAQLPLSLNRHHDQATEDVTRKRISSCDIAIRQKTANPTQSCWQVKAISRPISQCWRQKVYLAANIDNCQTFLTIPFQSKQQCARFSFRASKQLKNCQSILIKGIKFTDKCSKISYKSSKFLGNCSSINIAQSLFLNLCNRIRTRKTDRLQTCQTSPYNRENQDINYCQRIKIPPALVIPCQYYPVPEPPPPPPPIGVCGLKPNSDQLPFLLNRSNLTEPAFMPLPLHCWREQPAQSTNQRSYIMHHNITATIDGKPADLLSINIQTNVDAYCWQCSADLPLEQFKQLNLDERAEPPILTVEINGYQWTFLLEQNYRDNRRHAAHGGHSYTLTGRSLTARLGADYASTKQGIIADARYARQIATEQLEFLPTKIDRWLIPDWHVPANIYAITGKTPIAVIGDIAQAAGGFIYSHPNEDKIDLLPRWKNPAWNLGEPQVSIPATAIISISGQKQTTPRANGVRLLPSGGGQAGNIYRTGTNGLPALPDKTHALYTESPVWIAAGKAALSATGTHKQESLELPFSQKHGVPLAMLADVWKVAEPDNEWLGVVTQISISVRNNGGAISIRQNLTLDRYLGD